MVPSLPSVPHFHQGRLQTFTGHAKIFDVLLYLLSRGLAVFDQEGKCPAPVERRQSLDHMVAADHSLVISSGKFVDGACPELIAVNKITFIKSGDSLQLTERGWRKNRFEHRLQLGHSGA